MYVETAPAPAVEVATCPALEPDVCVVLRQARDLLADESKWCKAAWDKDGQHCVNGAINVFTLGDAGHDLDLNTRAKNALGRFVWGCDPNYGAGSLMTFNDNRETTHADMMTLFARALEGCE